MQVTYADHPLYHYAPDTSPGDTSGQGVGDVWFVVEPQGRGRDGQGCDGPRLLSSATSRLSAEAAAG